MGDWTFYFCILKLEKKKKKRNIEILTDSMIQIRTYSLEE